MCRRAVFGAALLLAAAMTFAVHVSCHAQDGAQDCPPPRQGLFDRVPTVERAVNPVPGEGDLELPMPCNATMVLRAVCVPAQGYLYDFQADLGCDDCGRPDLAYMERRHPTPVSGPFTLAELPPAWQRQLRDQAASGGGRCPAPDDPTAQAYYYFIGKYEVSNFQWNAVMNGSCPDPDALLDADAPRPRTEISWYEALAFTERYTQWLLTNAPDALPRFSERNPGFLRLPTEAEWEYAARGGHMASELEIDQERFFPMAPERTIDDYAVFTDPGAAQVPENMAWIGTRCPNPLGLFDTAGNAGEMVLDLFRFSLGLRLHGASGGVVLKGGSYLKSESEILPGRREEMPLFVGNEPFRGRDVGFRVVLSAIVTPEARLAELMDEWAEAGESVALTRPETWFGDNGSARDPLAAIDRLVADSEDLEEIENLLYLKGIIKDHNIVVEQRSSEAARGVIRSALLTMETIMNYAFRRQVIRDKREDFVAMRDRMEDDEARSRVDAALAEADSFLAMLDSAIDESLLFYIDRVKESRNYPQEVFEAQLRRVRDELGGDDPFNEVLLKRFAVYSLHVDRFRHAEGGTVSKDDVTRDIIPENYR